MWQSTRSHIGRLGVNVLIVLTSLALLVSGCSGGGQKSSFEVRVAHVADPVTLDPQKPGGSVGGNFVYNLFDPLVFFDKDGKVIPWLAESWKQTSDTTWEIKLRKGVKFHNGETFDAESVKFTLDRMFEPGKVRTTYGLAGLTKWEVVDAWTIKLTTKTPDRLLPNKLADLEPLPPKYAKEVGEDAFGQKPIGTGAYKFVEWKPNQQVTLEANEHYWGGRPKVDKLVFVTIPEASTRVAELLNGTIDIMVDLNPEYATTTMKGNSAVRVEQSRSKRTPFVGMDLLPEGPVPLKDKRVRQALNYAVDKDAIVKNILGGYGYSIPSIFRPDFPGWDDSVKGYPYDPEKAKALLAEAGYPSGFKIKIQTSSSIILKGLEVAQAVAGYLTKVGVECDVVPLELNAYRSIVIGGQKQHKVEGLFLWNYGCKPGSPDAVLVDMLTTGTQTSYYSTPELDSMVASARAENDAVKQADLYKRIQQYLLDEAPFIFLYQQCDIYGVSNKINWSARLDQYILGREITAR